jgi:tetratricopeptide (TPR) repeat protein
VDYLLVASIRAAGGRLRVAARLAAAATDAQLWAERFEGDLADTFALQDRVAQAVAGALALRIDEAELRAASHRPAESLEPHALWLRGMQCLRRGAVEADLEARRLFEQALALDRDYARAWAGLSLSHFNDWSCAAWERWEETERKAFEYAVEATRRDPHDPVTQCILGRILLYRREFERAAEHLARAHALNPNEPDVLAHLSLGHAYLGEPERGLALGETALRLNPSPPDWYLPCVAANHLVARRPREGPSSSRVPRRTRRHARSWPRRAPRGRRRRGRRRAAVRRALPGGHREGQEVRGRRAGPLGAAGEPPPARRGPGVARRGARARGARRAVIRAPGRSSSSTGRRLAPGPLPCEGARAGPHRARETP